MRKVAIIGSGISGLMCARILVDHGCDVTVFEKSRGVGGRMATRRAGDSLQFDHGAQYFTVRDQGFRQYVESWIECGIVQPWTGRIVAIEAGVIKEGKDETERFVGAPRMNTICRHLAKGMDVRFETRVAPLLRRRDQWYVSSEDGAALGSFDVAIVSAPAAQAAELLVAAPLLADRVCGVQMQACWAGMLAFPKSLELGFEGAFVAESPLAWIACNSSKPGRAKKPEAWILHASPDWSDDHLEAEPEVVKALLVDAFRSATGVPGRQPLHTAAHRWRYALPTEPLAENCLFEQDALIGACGDWCAGPRVEGACLSGMAAAERVLGAFQTSAGDSIGW